jgi:hypothetical protein
MKPTQAQIKFRVRRNAVDVSAPPETLFKMITATWVSQALYVAAELGLADLLKDGPRHHADLAKAAGVQADPLRRVLRALASVGVFAEREPGRFELTPLAEFLRSDVPGSMRAMARMFGADWHWRAHGDILYCLDTGRPSFERVYGKGLFDYFNENPEAGKLFGEAISGGGPSHGHPAVAAYDLSSFNTIVDVGGGYGGFIISALKANPDATGILFDLPLTVEGARARVEAAGLNGRCQLFGGDFFKSVPAGGDVYFSENVIHDWNDEKALAILKNIHRAMPAHGKLLLFEMLIPEGNEPFFGKLLDLEMMVLVGGKERTEAEFRALYEAAGFRLTRITPTESPLSLIEGVKVNR